MTTAGPRDDRGQTLIEFALIVPIFLLLLLGLFDLGRAVFYQSTIANAAREAARLAIVDQNVTAIENRAVSAADGVMPISAADVTVGFPSGSCVGCIVTVSVTHGFMPATPFVGTLGLKAETELPIEYTYQSP